MIYNIIHPNTDKDPGRVGPTIIKTARDPSATYASRFINFYWIRVEVPPRHPPSYCILSLSKGITPDKLFIEDGTQIRRPKSGRCVPEDEWKPYNKINEVRSPTRSECGAPNIVLDLTRILHVQE